MGMLQKTLCILFALIFAACQMSDDEATVTEKVTVGSRLPDISIMLNDGRQVTSASLKGKIAVIVFFSTKCADCRRELPEVERFYRSCGEGVEVMAISRGEGADLVEPFWQGLSLSLPYSAQPTRQVYEMFATSIVPRIYIADTTGTIIAAYDDSHMPSAAELLSVVNYHFF